MRCYLRISLFILFISNIIAQEPTRTLAVLDFEPRGINSLEAATLTDRFTSEIGKTEAMLLVNPMTTINYDLPSRSRVNLVIYDIMGREVVTLLNEERNEGYHSIIWNTRNDVGTPVSAGIYFYQIQAKDFVKTRKMVLLK